MDNNTNKTAGNGVHRWVYVLLVSLLLMWHQTTFAVPSDLGAYVPIEDGFQKFINTTHAATSTALASTDYVIAVDILWLFFVILLVVWTMFRYALKGVRLEEVIAMVIMAMMTRVLIATFDPLTTGIWEFGQGVGGAIQYAMIGNSNLFFAPQFIADLVKQITLPTYGLLDIAAAMYGALATFLIGAIAVVLSVMAFLASIWAFWGYTLSKIIGLLFVPFLLYERMAFLFDGWLRFFLGFIVYALVARINVVLVVVALAMYYNIPISATASTMPTIPVPAVGSIMEMLGMLTFALIGIVALASTGRFAGTILSGAGGGGIGQGAAQLAKTAGQLAVGKKF